MSRIVAIVGRPNVGKSTLFNRLIEAREAIVDETSGVTRDRNYGKSDWNGKEFSVIDTGGYVEGSEDVFEEEINKQVVLAMEEADVIIFLVDVLTGVTEMDRSVAKLLRQQKIPVFLAVNKVDTHQRIADSYEFYSLGLGEDIYPLSSINGSGTGELLDDVVACFEEQPDEEHPDLPRITVVGRPNVGKSTLINTFLEEERNIVTDVAGTTRDTLYTRYNKFGYDFLLVDTAGIRKKGRVKEDVEFYSVMRSVRAVENSDVCIMMLDAERGIEAQDVNIFRLIKNNNKGVLVVVNKWDKINKETNTARDYEGGIKEKIAPFRDVPVVFISALNKTRVHKVLEISMDVYKNLKKVIPTSELNNYMLEAIQKTSPPSVKGKHVKIKYVTQLRTRSPAFAFFCNLPQYVKDPYMRYLENKIREKWNFTGVPIKIFMRKK
jgi:GTPase